MSSVQKILDSELPSPTFSLLPGLDAPLPGQMSFIRPDVDNPDPTARTLDPRSGKFTGRGADVPRIYGAQQSLIVESGQRTNYQVYSSDHSQWVNSGVTLNAVNSILEGETAHELVNNGNATDSIQGDSGTFTSNREVIWAILEGGNSSEYEVRVSDTTDFNYVAGFSYDFGSNSVSVTGNATSKEVRKREITNNGPNGGRVSLIVCRYDPTDINGTDYSGRGRQTQHFPDRSANLKNGIAHHTQAEEWDNASTPFVSGGNPTTRGADDVIIFENGVPEWWNPNEGTIFCEFSINNLFIIGAGQESIVGDSTFGDEWLLIDDRSDPFRLGIRNNANDLKISLRQHGASGYEKIKYAASVTPGEIRAAANGVYGKSAGDVSNLLTPTSLDIGHTGAYTIAIDRLYYSPKALPTSESDRSAGDPVSLETLTS